SELPAAPESSASPSLEEQAVSRTRSAAEEVPAKARRERRVMEGPFTGEARPGALSSHRGARGTRGTCTGQGSGPGTRGRRVQRTAVWSVRTTGRKGPGRHDADPR